MIGSQNTSEWVVIIGGIIGFAQFSIRVIRRINQINYRVDAMWEFLSDRGGTETLSKKLTEKKSPHSIDNLPNKDQIISLYAPLISDIEKAVVDCKGNLDSEPDDPKLFECVATRFGKKLAVTICPVLGVHEGGCVTLALAVLRHTRKNRLPLCGK